MVEYAIFDLYHAFVEIIFGHFAVAIIAIGIVFFLMALILRVSLIVSLSILSLFFFAMFVGYFGSIVGIFIFVLAGTYFGTSLVRFLIRTM